MTSGHQRPRTSPNARASDLYAPIRSNSSAGTASDHATLSQTNGTNSAMNAGTRQQNATITSQTSRGSRRSAKPSERPASGSTPSQASPIALKHAAVANRIPRNVRPSSTRIAPTSFPLGRLLDDDEVSSENRSESGSIEEITSVDRISIGSTIPTTQIISGFQWRRYSLIPASRTSPTPSGR